MATPQPLQTNPAEGEEAALPLYVDLDGTLVAIDTLRACLLALARGKPWLVPLLPFCVLMGRAWFKDRVSRWATIEPETLPYRREVLMYLEEQRSLGRRIILATAANVRIAEAVASHLKLFDAVIASDHRYNLKGHAKLRAIQSHLRETQAAVGFEYMGDSLADLPILRAARRGILVGSSRRLRAQAPSHCRVLDGAAPP
ncbi:MAG TPA: haloacid dehalogenase-like hydrolase [Isosphaeraceae bacterium]|jgi:phosphoserine phosphatase|nr:haloacid dehalogenase-like hydrolase [Isosphaeraceae bacterium]